MTCDSMIQNLQWLVQGHSFISSLGILPLKCFDMILGEDWLETVSPMWVHWAKKIMRFTYQGQRVELHGVQPQMEQCSAISTDCLSGLIRRHAVQHCFQLKVFGSIEDIQEQSVCTTDIQSQEDLPDAIKQLLLEFQDLFQKPKSLPPPRSFDHHIQLLPGSSPVNIRPSKYSLA